VHRAAYRVHAALSVQRARAAEPGRAGADPDGGTGSVAARRRARVRHHRAGAAGGARRSGVSGAGGGAAPPIIEAEHLSRRFGDVVAVRDVSLSVAPGEIFGVLGPNGAGKSTTIRMLCGILDPSGGRGTVVGHDIAREAERIKEVIGYMTQRFSL